MIKAQRKRCAAIGVIAHLRGDQMTDVQDSRRARVRAKMKDLITLAFIANLDVNTILERAGSNPKLLLQIRDLLSRACVNGELRNELMVAEMRRQREEFDTRAPQGETAGKLVSAAVHGQGHMSCL